MKLLIVEDNDDHFEMIEDVLEELAVEPEYARCKSMSEGLLKLESNLYDVCLMDLVLPDSTLDESLETLSRLSQPTPVIAITSINDNQIAKRLLSAGFQDFVSKDELSASVLSRACRYAMQRQDYVTKNDRLTRDMQAFCNSLSHSFLSRIHQITEVVELLKTNTQNTGAPTHENDRWFDFLAQSTTNIESLVKNLRQLLNIEATNIDFQLVNLKLLIRGTEDFLRNSLNDTFQLELGDIDVDILGDQYLLNTLFVHLLTNAINYSDSPAIIKVVGKRGDNVQIIEIIDNGIGFRDEALEDVFEPFVRLESKTHGTGLGLAICKKIAEKHNGSISISSEYEYGTTVQLRFPL